MYTTSSDDVQKIIRENAKDLYETDFDLYENNDSKMIAIKNPSPDSVDKLWWGDYWFGLDLAQGLKDQGFNVRTDYAEDFERLGKQDINLVIRGPKMFKSFDNKKLNIIYLMSRSKDVKNDELSMYDIIICASMKYTKRLRHKGYNNVHFLPQFTNPKRFYFEKNEKFQNDILFVGNAYHNTFRPAVKYAVECGIPISIYGKFWKNIVDSNLIKGLYIDNNDLHKYYSNAKIVINDTNEDMRINGFVSNRIHDATACKAFVISDYMPEIKELYGDSVPMFRNKEEFQKLVNYYLKHPEERKKKALKAYEITKKLCTNQKFANDFSKIISTAHKLEHNSAVFYEKIIKDWYYSTMKEYLNLTNPQTYNEKMQWLKLYDSTPIKTLLADKYLVRDWVKEKIGEQYIIPLIGVYDNFDEINFDKLPDQFVIKCNHGSGYNIVVKDKSTLDIHEAKLKIEKWMEENFAFKAGCELHYREVPPKIIIEKFIENKKAGDLYDYKFWCFNGKVEYIQFLSERNIGEHSLKMAFYDTNWNKQSFVYSYPLDTKTIEKPDNLDKMIELSEQLSKGFPHVRVDFYRLDDGSIYFGEMTFSSASGSCRWNSKSINVKLGNLIKLPTQAYNIDTGKYYKLPKPGIIKNYILFPYYMYKSHQMKKFYINQIVSKIKSQLTNFRIDLKNFGSAENSLEVSAEGISIIQPKWFTNAQGIGSIIQGNQLKNTIKLKVIKDGILKIIFKGIDKRIEKEKLPLWIDYKSIKIDGKEILDFPVATWHDKPYIYETPVKDGQEITLVFEQQYHEYLENEINDLLLNLYYSNEQIVDNLDILMNVLKKQVPIIDIETKNKRELEKKIPEILSSLTSYRLDIKNYGLNSNNLEIVTNNAAVREEKWFTNEQGIGKILQGKAMRNIIKLIIINDGELRIDFKGIDKRVNGKANPLWIDYKSIKIDGKEILSEPVATCHDKPYRYRMSVKDGQKITLEFEQQYHCYSNQDIDDVLSLLFADDKYINEYKNIIIEKLGNILPSNKAKEVNLSTPIISDIPLKKTPCDFSNIINVITSFRIDAKFISKNSSNLKIDAENLNISLQNWLNNMEGISYTIEGCLLKQKIKLTPQGYGVLILSFRGICRKNNNKDIPIYADYKSIKIDGKEILNHPISTWHNKPYSHQIEVKENQEIIVEVECSPHRYLRKDIEEIVEIISNVKENKKDLVDEGYQYLKLLTDSHNRYCYQYPKTVVEYPCIRKKLEVKIYDDATVLPAQFIGFNSNLWAKGGVIDKDKNYIYESSQGRELNEKYDFSDFETSTETVLYLGFIFKHWGHFIMEYIHRLWPIVMEPEKYKDIKIVYLPKEDKDVLDGNFIEFLDLLGIKSSQLLRVEKPTLFKKVIIPEIPITVSKRDFAFSVEIRAIIEKVKKEAMKRKSSIKFYDKIYLSHAHWKGANNRDIGESDIENFFNLNGFQSIYPEELTVTQQIQLIYNAKQVVSVLGTMSHNFMFASNETKCIIIGKYFGYSNFQSLADSISGIQPIRIDCHASVFNVDDGVGPFLYDVNSNLKLFANDNDYILPSNNNREANLKEYIGRIKSQHIISCMNGLSEKLKLIDNDMVENLINKIMWWEI